MDKLFVNRLETRTSKDGRTYTAVILKAKADPYSNLGTVEYELGGLTHLEWKHGISNDTTPIFKLEGNGSYAK